MQTTILKPTGANGLLSLKIGTHGPLQDVTVVGGPFRNFKKSDNSFGICLLEKALATADEHMPIEDFSVPELPIDTVQKVIRKALAAAIQGKHVWVGCAGGWGRTGLMLALIAKTTGEEHPVSYVRANYTSKAVETYQQEQYVRDFPVEDLKWFFRKERAKAVLRGFFLRT